jgi:hypothetical protein
MGAVSQVFQAVSDTVQHVSDVVSNDPVAKAAALAGAAYLTAGLINPADAAALGGADVGAADLATSIAQGGAGDAAASFGGSGSLYDAAASPLASGYGGETSAVALGNQAVASGMAPGALGASMAAEGALSPAELAAAQGVVTEGSALSGLASAGNTAALSDALAKSLTSQGGGNYQQLINTAKSSLNPTDSGQNPGGFLNGALMAAAPLYNQGDSLLKELPKLYPQMENAHAPTVAALTGVQKGAQPVIPQRYKDGGLSHHVPEFITGATGHYVKGRGDGQSDDIPAMLADGEYVFDADTVAALGNGSSDAGAKRLDEMRERIRKHKRSAPIHKIPPKAKSPLEYLKG